MNEIIKYILLTCGPCVTAVGIIVYLMFWFKGFFKGDEKKLKDSLSRVLRENAELKMELQKQRQQTKELIDKVSAFIDEIEEVEENE